MEINVNFGVIKLKSNTTRHQIIILLILLTTFMQIIAWIWQFQPAEHIFMLYSNVVTGALAYGVAIEAQKNKINGNGTTKKT